MSYMCGEIQGNLEMLIICAARLSGFTNENTELNRTYERQLNARTVLNLSKARAVAYITLRSFRSIGLMFFLNFPTIYVSLSQWVRKRGEFGADHSNSYFELSREPTAQPALKENSTDGPGDHSPMGIGKACWVGPWINQGAERCRWHNQWVQPSANILQFGHSKHQLIRDVTIKSSDMRFMSTWLCSTKFSGRAADSQLWLRNSLQWLDTAIPENVHRYRLHNHRILVSPSNCLISHT